MAIVVVIATAAAQDSDEAAGRLDEIETSLAEAASARAALSTDAAAIADELDLMRARMLASEHETRELEQSLVEITETLEELRPMLKQHEAEYVTQLADFGVVLAALQRIARQPADMLIAMPASPTDIHRTAMLLAAVTPALEQHVGEIAESVRSLTALRDDTEQQESERIATIERIRLETAESAAVLERKRELLIIFQDSDAELAAQQATLIAEAQSLNDLIAGLQAQAEREATVRDDAMAAAMDALAATRFSTQKGLLPLPVDGAVVVNFQDQLTDGRISSGLNIQAGPDSRVVTPYDGQVAYAGPFQDYGHLLIIDHGEGYHSVLAGFARVDVILGQWLLAGEPIGVMSSNQADQQVLYVELRRNGDPINPLPWIAARNSEMSGG
ncbi:MAG: peptidoglycan DD-metalloendopeptidase family protein [Rhodospirillaceae bacterium]|nr:peptidoglycan DD-metalloendopeptidase family protein [Rhodospirillaceae bacterium]